jgi:septal ring factor EnvC (AmiA/AmiB activator)
MQLRQATADARQGQERLHVATAELRAKAEDRATLLADAAELRKEAERLSALLLERDAGLRAHEATERELSRARDDLQAQADKLRGMLEESHAEVSFPAGRKPPPRMHCMHAFVRLRPGHTRGSACR